LRVRANSNTDKPGIGAMSGCSNALNDPNEKFDYFYKIIVIGDEFVGKTNFLLRVSKNYYDPEPKTTYGVEFEFKTVPLPDSNQKVKA
jgi:GTPase SAR1 family protein